MYRDHEIGVVVPAYNEEGFVGDVVREMPSYVDRIYVVDDRSTDGTWDEIVAAAHVDASEYAGPKTITLADGGVLERRGVVHDRIGRVVPIRHRENRGAGGAIKTGYLIALADGVDITVTVDGDGQMDLEQMPRLLDPIVEKRVDYAKGNRLLSREVRGEMPPLRFAGNSILTFLTKVASGYWKMMDPQNGYTAISYRALDAVDVEELYEYYGYCNDLLVKLNVHGMRIGDVAMEPIYGDEESSIEYTTYVPKVSGMLARNFLWRLNAKHLVRDFHPLALFYYAGGATAAIATLSGLWSLYAWAVRDDGSFLRGVLTVLLFAVSGLFALFAMVLDVEVNDDLVVRIHE